MNADDRQRLGPWLRGQRQQRGLSSRAVALRLGINHTHVCNIERGVGLPGLELLERWLRVFDVDLFAAIKMR